MCCGHGGSKITDSLPKMQMDILSILRCRWTSLAYMLSSFVWVGGGCTHAQAHMSFHEFEDHGASSGIAPQKLLTFFPGAESLTEPRAHHLARPAGQRAPGIFLLPLPPRAGSPDSFFLHGFWGMEHRFSGLQKHFTH